MVFSSSITSHQTTFTPNLLGLSVAQAPSVFNIQGLKDALMSISGSQCADTRQAKTSLDTTDCGEQDELGGSREHGLPAEIEPLDEVIASDDDFSIHAYYVSDDDEPLKLSSCMARALSQSESLVMKHIHPGIYEPKDVEELEALALPGLSLFALGPISDVPELDGGDSDCDTSSECSSLASFESDKFIGLANDDGAYTVEAHIFHAKDGEVTGDEASWASWEASAAPLHT